jgi:hypothetical protein
MHNEINKAYFELVSALIKESRQAYRPLAAMKMSTKFLSLMSKSKIALIYSEFKFFIPYLIFYIGDLLFLFVI